MRRPTAAGRPACVALVLVSLPFTSIAQSSFRSMGVDAECEQQHMAVATGCSQEANPVMKACLQRRLSPRCAAQANAPSTTPRDAACQEEFKVVAVPCGKEFVDEIGRCTQNGLSDKCRSQIATASQKAQQMEKRCQDEMSRRLEQTRLCFALAAPQEQNACLASMKKDNSACEP